MRSSRATASAEEAVTKAARVVNSRDQRRLADFSPCNCSNDESLRWIEAAL